VSRSATPALTLAALLTNLAFAVPGCGGEPALDEELEQAYRANNRGVALLEQFDYEQAAAAFREALAAEESLSIAHLNLSLALLYAQDLQGALASAAEAERLLPSAPQPPYVIGLVERAQNRTDEAIRAFERVREIDPSDVGTRVNLGQVYMEGRRYDEAIALLRDAVATEPYNVTAAYNLGLALTRNGQGEEGKTFLDRAQGLRDTGYAVTYGTGYLEQGRYAEAMASTGTEEGLVDEDVPDARFERQDLAPAVGQNTGACLTSVDAEGDGTPWLFVAAEWGQRLYRRTGATFEEFGESGVASLSASGPAACVSGDLDMDGRPDLLVLRAGATALYHGEGNGRFSDVTARSGLGALAGGPGAVALTDVDHDGDLDVVMGAGTLALWRNNGNGTFTDITSDAGLTRGTSVVAIVPTDFDNRRDVDLLVVSATAAPVLYQNQRDGTFRDVAADSGLAEASGGAALSIAAGDLNADGFTDFFFGRPSNSSFALSDGRGRFTASSAPSAVSADRAAQLVDYDLDGLLDLVAWTGTGARVLRNLGTRWEEVTDAAIAGESAVPGSSRALAVADFDADGRTDVASAGDQGLVLMRATGDESVRSVRVDLTGRVSNRGGVGSRIEVRAGSLRVRLERSAASPPVAPADVIVGIGPRQGADVVRVLWPSGILQAEATDGLLPSVLRVEELDRKPSSCPFLFVWNGERFEFVTDFLGAGEMGYWLAPGLRSTPDPVEYVRIPRDLLRVRDGRYELRVTNELEEVLFLDHVQLLAVDHPDEIDVYPDEGMTGQPKPFRLFATRDARAPRARDDAGMDLTERIAAIDRRYADGFPLERIRGYAGLHGLTLDLDSSAHDLLLLTGWTDYAFSSDNVAAHQAGLSLVPPRLDARAPGGTWRTVVEDVGVPVGRPQTVTVDLTGRLRPGETELRIVTSMRIYWDRILVAQKADGLRLEPGRLDPVSATLAVRGYSEEVRPDGLNPPVYDFSRVTTASPWKTLVGHYTRVGDVLPLMSATDDMFVVANSGDEIALSFDASSLPALREGWTRTFLMMADGYSKEMDINSASPDRVEPLPFHTMTSYPYEFPERYPSTRAHDEYRTRYNTRSASRPAPPIDVVSLGIE